MSYKTFQQMEREREHRRTEGNASADALSEGKEGINELIHSKRSKPAPPDGDMNAWIRNRGRTPPEEES